LHGLGMVVLALALGAHLTGLYLYGTSLALRMIVASAVPVLGIAASALLMPNVVGAVRCLLGLRPPVSSRPGLPNRWALTVEELRTPELAAARALFDRPAAPKPSTRRSWTGVGARARPPSHPSPMAAEDRFIGPVTHVPRGEQAGQTCLELEQTLLCDQR